jgi:hypothetical protein
MRIETYFARKSLVNHYFGEIEIRTDEGITYILEFHASNCRIHGGKFFNPISEIPSMSDVDRMHFELSICKGYTPRDKIQQLETSMRETIARGA